MLYDKDPEYYGQIITTALNRQTHYYRGAFEPDGQSAEGIGYFNYGFSFTELGQPGGPECAGDGFWPDGYGWHPERGLVPVQDFRYRGRVEYWGRGAPLRPEHLPHLAGQPVSGRGLEKLVYSDKIKSGGYEWRDLLFYDPSCTKKAMSGTATMPRLTTMCGISSWSPSAMAGDKGPVYFHSRGRQPGPPHGHVDAGQVDIQANGICWVMGSLRQGGLSDARRL